MSTYQNIWDVLDLPEKPEDVRTVKRAYAAKLKTIKQDENPEEFMTLRNAYEAALLVYRQPEPNARQQEIHDPEDQQTENASQDSQHPDFDPIAIVFGLLKETDIPDVIGQWHHLFEHPDLELIDNFLWFEQGVLNNILHWRGYLLTDDEIKNNSFKPDIPPLTPQVFKFLWDRFGWEKQTISIHPEMAQALQWLAVDTKKADVNGMRTLEKESSFGKELARAYPAFQEQGASGIGKENLTNPKVTFGCLLSVSSLA